MILKLGSGARSPLPAQLQDPHLIPTIRKCRAPPPPVEKKGRASLLRRSCCSKNGHSPCSSTSSSSCPIWTTRRSLCPFSWTSTFSSWILIFLTLLTSSLSFWILGMIWKMIWKSKWSCNTKNLCIDGIFQTFSCCQTFWTSSF